MLYACLAVIAVLIIFVGVTFFMTLKNFKFQLAGGELKVKNIGSHLKIFFNNVLIKDVFSPQLLNGEKVDFEIGEKQYKLSCKTNAFGNKMQIEVFEGETLVADNGVKTK